MGNPYRLINTVDYTNHICGFNDGFKDLPYGYYLPDKTAVCVKTCPAVTDYQSFYCKYDIQSIVDNDQSKLLGFYYLSRSECMYKIKTKVMLNRCVPDVDAAAIAKAFGTFHNLTGSNSSIAGSTAYPSSSTAASYISLFWSDILLLLQLIAPMGLVLSTLMAFSYLSVLQTPGLLFVTIWGIMLSIQGVLVLFSILLFTLSTAWAADGLHSPEEVIAMRVFACLGYVVCFLYFCFLIVMRKRVQLATHIIQEAARAMAAMPFLIVMPVVQVAGCVCFLVPWFIYMVYLASAGEMVTTTGTNAIGQSYQYRQFVYTKNTQYTFIFMLFCWFWTSEFIIALGQMSIALAVVAWYFTREKGKVGNTTVFWAVRTALRYHMGTAAFGSMIIAIVKTARAVIAYLQKQAKVTKNRLMQYLLCVLQCCMWCLEKCMKFVNKNAYIQTAIYGHSFCKAMRGAFFLIVRNILRVAAVNMVGDFVLMLGKVRMVWLWLWV
jgi:choline transporter-like protein 2/4/5